MEMVRPPKEKRSQTQSTLNPEIASYASPLDLPIGYRFAPEDEELVLILHQWKKNSCFNHPSVHHVNIYDSSPQQLSERFEKGNDENEWFFISKRTKLCNGGKNLKRGNNEGYWDARTAAKKINAGKGLIGYRTLLKYFVGKHPNGVESDWRMHEYSFKSSHDNKVDYAVCKIFLTPRAAKKKMKKEEELGIVDHAPQVFAEEVEQSQYQQQSQMMQEEEQQMLLMMPEAEEEQQQSLMMMMPEIEDEQQHQHVTWSLPPLFPHPQGQDSGMEIELTNQNNENNNIVPDDEFDWVMKIPDEDFDFMANLSEEIVL